MSNLMEHYSQDSGPMPSTWTALRHCIDTFNEAYPEAPYSFAHIVLADDNLDDHCIRWCLEDAQINEWEDYWKTLHASEIAGPAKDPYYVNHVLEEFEQTKQATVAFLQWLLTVPENIRDEAQENSDATP